ncbi:class I SAM-dependent methyltransferase [Gorillibacterium sp. sgz5001074]|uniref:class I SAM-dependent methyltransferase n=1 Tax=Gorillibacterium sp. sgz5001074 TaxID=3446695 RepID=UPI003F663CFF
MPDHDKIYHQQAELYEALVSKQPSLLDLVNGIRPVRGLDIVDAGAGTGRLSAVLAPYARSLTALDASEAMLALTAQKLAASGLPQERWRCAAADHRRLPLPDASCDLLVSGWSVCYLASSNRPDWEADLDRALAEFRRVLRTDGTLVLFETMGTGVEKPEPPSFLTGYYRLMEERYGFARRIFPFDYTFGDWREAERCVRAFFGDGLADQVRRERLSTVKEYAGMWWLTAPARLG